MPAVTPDIVFGTGTHWAFMAQESSDGSNDWWITGNIPGIREYGDLVIIDGLSVRYDNLSLANETVLVSVYSSTRGAISAAHTLGYYTVNASATDVHAFFPLNIPTTLTSNPLIYLTIVDSANLDQILVSAWGRYVPSPTTEPEAVTVKGVEFFRKKAPVGPI